MKTLKLLAVSVGTIILVLLIAGWSLPDRLRTTRVATLQCSPLTAFGLVNNLRTWKTWTWWSKQDPRMHITYGATTRSEGAFYTWQSKTQGRGKLVITKSSSPRRIETHITFTEPFQAQSTGHWTFAPEGRGTSVSWSMIGQASGNPIMRLMNAMWIKPQLNDQFDYGLRELNRLCR